jgi:hypothetical protein
MSLGKVHLTVFNQQLPVSKLSMADRFQPKPVV